MENEQNINSDFSFKLTQLISRLERKRKRYINSRFSEYKLKGAMFMILLLLNKHPGESQDFLAEHLAADKSNVARMAGLLQSGGYITRSPMPENRRKYSLFLTDSGKELTKLILKALNEYSASVTEGLSFEERKNVVELLNRMLENTQKIY